MGENDERVALMARFRCCGDGHHRNRVLLAGGAIQVGR